MQPTPEDTQNCSDSGPEALIRVTVSILVKQQSRGGNNRSGSNSSSVRRGNGRYVVDVCKSFV